MLPAQTLLQTLAPRFLFPAQQFYENTERLQSERDTAPGFFQYLQHTRRPDASQAAPPCICVCVTTVAGLCPVSVEPLSVWMLVSIRVCVCVQAYITVLCCKQMRRMTRTLADLVS